MDENVWKVIQIGMWVIGIQTAFITAVIGFVYNSLSKKIDQTNARIDQTNTRIDKLSEKVEDVDRRLCRIEGSLATQGHCLFNQAHHDKKAQ